MRWGKQFLPPVWIPDRRPDTVDDRHPWQNNWPPVVEARLAAREAMAASRGLIEIIQASVQTYAPTKGDADGQQGR
jgi:hypothetical protein